MESFETTLLRPSSVGGAALQPRRHARLKFRGDAVTHSSRDDHVNPARLPCLLSAFLDHPDESISTVYEALGFSVWEGTSLKVPNDLEMTMEPINDSGPLGALGALFAAVALVPATRARIASPFSRVALLAGDPLRAVLDVLSQHGW